MRKERALNERARNAVAHLTALSHFRVLGQLDSRLDTPRAVRPHASARASTKTHTANRRRISWPSCLLEVRRRGIGGRVVSKSHLPHFQT